MKKKLLALVSAVLVLSGTCIHAQEKLHLQGEGHAAFELALKIKYMEPVPQNVVMINPTGFGQTAENTVYPIALPPYYPEGSNLVMVLEKDLPECDRNAAIQYMKTWKGWGGEVTLLDSREGISDALYKMMTAKKDPNYVNSAAQSKNPNKEWTRKRHEEKAKLFEKNQYRVVFLGNSITNNMEKRDYQPVWKKYYGDRMAINLGVSAHRTENLLWEVENYELEKQHPDICILGIGTNNIDEKHYRYRCTAEELAGGIKALLDEIRRKCPESKVLLLRCFPGSYDGQLPTSHRMILEKASDIVSTFADQKNVFYVDVNHVFINADGSLIKEMFVDWLHPTPAGAERWFASMEPLVCKILGDKDHRGDLPANTAIEPATRSDVDWAKLHEAAMAAKDSFKPQVLFFSDSSEAICSEFEGKKVLRIGHEGDKIQNILWRLDNGEVDGLHPSDIVLRIGNNNVENTKEEVAEGLNTVYIRLRSKFPNATIVVK